MLERRQLGNTGDRNWVKKHPEEELESACATIGTDLRLASEACPLAYNTCPIN
jgi:hypothetical protein